MTTHTVLNIVRAHRLDDAAGLVPLWAAYTVSRVAPIIRYQGMDVFDPCRALSSTVRIKELRPQAFRQWKRRQIQWKRRLGRQQRQQRVSV